MLDGLNNSRGRGSDWRACAAREKNTKMLVDAGA
jgi:hypothetical protein